MLIRAFVAAVAMWIACGAMEMSVQVVNQSASVLCVCGPTGVITPSCAVLLPYTPSRYIDGRLLLFVRDASTQRAVYECLEARDVKRSLRLFWPRLPEASNIEIVVDPSVSERQCTGWQDTLLWHIARVYHHTPYHFLYDHGVLQAFMMRKAFLRRVPDLSRRTTFHLVDDLEPRNHTPEEKPPIHEILDAVIDNEYLMRSEKLFCSRWMTFGYWFESPMLYGSTWLLQAALREEIQHFADEAERYFTAKYGDVEATDTAVLVNEEPASVGYDSQQRARGIQPLQLQAMINHLPSQTGVPKAHVFSEGVAMKAQWQLLRSHKRVIAGEGGFFALMPLAGPRSTWLQVYNHSRAADTWRHSNFHAAIASSLRQIRLVILVLENGSTDATAAAMAEFNQRWRPGIFYFGANNRGYR